MRDELGRLKLDAALVTHPRHVHYLTGYWCRPVFAPHAWIERDGPTVLIAPLDVEPADVATDEVVVYESNRRGTLVDHQAAVAAQAIRERLSRVRRLGVDGPAPPWIDRPTGRCDLSDVFLTLRRKKDEDEVGLIRTAIAAAEAAYARAREILSPGVTEVELFAQMQAAAVARAGEGIGEFGNDFQIGALGSAPRPRAARSGEVAILDVAVVVRGYAGDLCRSLVVGGRPSESQLQAQRRILEVLANVEEQARPGASCRKLHDDATDMLDGHCGWAFKHHLGHGIGMCNHEAPRLNTQWDDTLRVGDVFAVEPGLYGDDLCAGIRIEQDYYLSPAGLVRLSSFPTDLT